MQWLFSQQIVASMRIKAFIVHLNRSTGRWPQVERLRTLLPMPVEVLPAIDGRMLSDAGYHRVVRRSLHLPWYPFLLSKAEAACFLSHRMAWQRLLSDGLDGALILEDDVDFLTADAPRVVAAALERLQPEEWIRLPFRDRGESGPVVRHGDGTVVIEPQMPGRGMLMQAVGPEAARRLLAASDVFDRPVDSFLQMQWVHAARVLSMRPIVICHIDHLLGGTELHDRHRGLADRAYREVCRPILRLSMHSANRQWRRRAA